MRETTPNNTLCSSTDQKLGCRGKADGGEIKILLPAQVKQKAEEAGGSKGECASSI